MSVEKRAYMNIVKRLGMGLLGLCMTASVAAAEDVWLTEWVGDGAQNASPAIQAALNTMPRGGVLHLIAGAYRLNTLLAIPPGVRLEGVGPNGTQLLVNAPTGVSLIGVGAGIRNVRMQSAVPGSTAISFVNATSNIYVDSITFESGFEIGLNIAPNQSHTGIFILSNLRWDVVERSPYPIRIGDGVHHISDITIRQVSGTALATTDVQTWVTIEDQTDTIVLDNLTLIRGGTGVLIGPYRPLTSPAVTGVTFVNSPAIESMSGYGVVVQSANNVRLSGLSLAQNAGGIGFGAGVRGAVLTGSTMHTNRGDGVTLWPGATDVIVANNLIADNNSGGSPYGFGISVGVGVTGFTFANNRIGNNMLWGGGYQRYCIFVAPGGSNRYSITGNSCSGHTAVNGDLVYDGGTGTRKVVTGNY